MSYTVLSTACPTVPRWYAREMAGMGEDRTRHRRTPRAKEILQNKEMATVEAGGVGVRAYV